MERLADGGEDDRGAATNVGGMRPRREGEGVLWPIVLGPRCDAGRDRLRRDRLILEEEAGWPAEMGPCRMLRLSQPLSLANHSLVNNAGLARGREHVGGESELGVAGR